MYNVISYFFTVRLALRALSRRFRIGINPFIISARRVCEGEGNDDGEERAGTIITDGRVGFDDFRRGGGRRTHDLRLVTDRPVTVGRRRRTTSWRITNAGVRDKYALRRPRRTAKPCLYLYIRPTFFRPFVASADAR